LLRVRAPFKQEQLAVLAHFEAVAPALEAVCVIFVMSAGAPVTVFSSLVVVPAKLVTIFPALVAVFLALVTVGAEFVTVLAELVTVAEKDVAVFGNFVMVFKKIASLKIRSIQSVGEFVRRATQNSSLSSRGWHEPFRGLSLPARSWSRFFPRSRLSAQSSSLSSRSS
jgi:hypothetical protein